MWSRNDVESSRSTFRINFFHLRALFCFVPVILMSSTYTDKHRPCVRWTNRHPQFGIFSIQIPIELLRTVFSHSSPASWCPYTFRSRGTTGSSMFDKDFCHLEREIRSIYKDMLTSGVWLVWERPCFYLSVSWNCVSCLSITVWSSCHDIHDLWSLVTQTSPL